MNKYEIVIGCDIGLNGGLAFFDFVSRELLSVYSMPTMKNPKNDKNSLDLDRLHFILEIPKVHNDRALIVMEDVHPFPGQGSVAIGTLMEQKGILRGMAKSLGYDELLVQPKTWQKFFGLVPPKDLKGSTTTKTKTLRKKWLKEESLKCARGLFPEWENKLSKSTDHGISDAILIGDWGLLSEEPNKSPLDELAQD